MNKIKLYFQNLIMCIIVFGFLQAVGIFASIIIQIFAIFILIYGVIGVGIWYKFKKEGDKDANS